MAYRIISSTISLSEDWITVFNPISNPASRTFLMLDKMDGRSPLPVLSLNLITSVNGNCMLNLIRVFASFAKADSVIKDRFVAQLTSQLSLLQAYRIRSAI